MLLWQNISFFGLVWQNIIFLATQDMYMHDPLPRKISQLDAPLSFDAVSFQLNSPACLCFTQLCIFQSIIKLLLQSIQPLFQSIQAKEVLLNIRTVPPRDWT